MTPPPKDIHVLVFGTSKCVAVNGKRDFVGVVKGGSQDVGVILDYTGGLNIITSVLTRGHQEVRQD